MLYKNVDDMSYPSRLQASLLLRLVVLAFTVSLANGNQYFEGIYCGEDNCYDRTRFVLLRYLPEIAQIAL